MDSGRDNREAVDPSTASTRRSRSPGTIEKVVFDIRRPEDPDAEAALYQAEHATKTGRLTES